MSNLTVIGTDAASLAAQLIEEWPSWPKSALRRELAQFQELASQVPPSSSLEAERIEVFLGATDSLESTGRNECRPHWMCWSTWLALSRLQGKRVFQQKSSAGPVLTICPLEPIEPLSVHIALRSTG